MWRGSPMMLGAVAALSAAGTGNQLALQAAARTDFEHRLIGLADGELQGCCMALPLEGIGQRFQPIRVRLRHAEEIRRPGAEPWTVRHPPCPDPRGIRPR